MQPLSKVYTGPLQELVADLLSKHVLPCLAAHLSCQPPRLRLPLAAIEHVARAVPPAWLRRDDVEGAAAAADAPCACAKLLHSFVLLQLLPKLGQAAGDAGLGDLAARRRALLVGLGLPSRG